MAAQETKIERLPLEFPEPGIGYQYNILTKDEHPLHEFAKVSASWLEGWHLANQLIPQMLTKHSLHIIGFAWSSQITNGFDAYAKCRKLASTNRIITTWHTMQEPELQTHKHYKITDPNLQKFLEFSAKKLFPMLDIVINDENPMRKLKNVARANMMNLLRTVREDGYLLARFTDPRDWNEKDRGMLNWLEQFGEVDIWLSPYQERRTWVIFKRGKGKITSDIMDKTRDEFPDISGSYTIEEQFRLATDHAKNEGDDVTWSRQFLDYF